MPDRDELEQCPICCGYFHPDLIRPHAAGCQDDLAMGAITQGEDGEGEGEGLDDIDFTATRRKAPRSHNAPVLIDDDEDDDEGLPALWSKRRRPTVLHTSTPSQNGSSSQSPVATTAAASGSKSFSTRMTLQDISNRPLDGQKHRARTFKKTNSQLAAELFPIDDLPSPRQSTQTLAVPVRSHRAMDLYDNDFDYDDPYSYPTSDRPHHALPESQVGPVSRPPGCTCAPSVRSCWTLEFLNEPRDELGLLPSDAEDDPRYAVFFLQLPGWKERQGKSGNGHSASVSSAVVGKTTTKRSSKAARDVVDDLLAIDSDGDRGENEDEDEDEARLPPPLAIKNPPRPERPAFQRKRGALRGGAGPGRKAFWGRGRSGRGRGASSSRGRR